MPRRTTKLGRLNEATFEALKPLRMSHIFAAEEIGGAQLSPTQGLELIEAITYHSGSAGWISMVHACIGAMSAAFLPDSAIARLYRAGHGEPLLRTGHAHRHAEEGRRRLSAERQVVLCERHLPRHLLPTAPLLDDGTGQPAKDENGDVIVLCAHAPVAEHELLGNWDVLGLRGDRQHRLWRQGRVHPRRHGVPDPDGASRSARRSSSASASSASRPSAIPAGRSARRAACWTRSPSSRAPRPAAPACSARATSSGSTSAAPKARVRAARAFLFEVWRDVEASIEAGNRVSTRQISLVHLAKSEVHEAGVDACQFVYRAAGGASLRAGVMQRIYREMLTAANHFTINPNIVGAAGRDIGGVWSDRVWQFYDLIEKK